MVYCYTKPKEMAQLVEGDRTLRADEWAGGYAPQDQRPKYRNWKVKDHVPKHLYEDNYLFFKKTGME